jgi:transposase
MKRKRTYKAVPVEQVRIEELLPLLAAGCIVALDVAKQRFLVALATLAGEVVKLFRFEHPTQTREFLAVVASLRAGIAADKVMVAMEPTGTYGDAIRHQLHDVGAAIWMVSPKRTHDSQEVFDGVPSLHDAKSAVLVARLCAMRAASRWAPAPTVRVQRRALIELRRHEQLRAEVCFGRLEALLSRHWPELQRWLDPRDQRSALRLLAVHPCPARALDDPGATKALLREASRSRLSSEAIDGVVADAQSSLGLPMVAEEEQLVRALSSDALDAGKRADDLEAQITQLAHGDDVLTRLMAWMGAYTATVLCTLCDPMQYASARQLEKACGLNLREKSSGEHVGRLSITKRGPGHVRQLLFLFALRMIRDSPVVAAWYQQRRGYTADSKKRAIVAVMRKLVRATFHVARGGEFQAEKLFDVRRLNIKEVQSIAKKIMPRTTPRAIASGNRRERSSRAAV